jgi:hypothetical protein
VVRNWSHAGDGAEARAGAGGSTRTRYRNGIQTHDPIPRNTDEHREEEHRKQAKINADIMHNSIITDKKCAKQKS